MEPIFSMYSISFDALFCNSHPQNFTLFLSTLIEITIKRTLKERFLKTTQVFLSSFVFLLKDSKMMFSFFIYCFFLFQLKSFSKGR